MTTKRITIDISHRTIFFILALFLTIVFFQHIASVLVGLLVAFLITVSLSPWVEYLARKHIPRVVSALFILIVIISIISFLVVSFIQPLLSQTSSFIQGLPYLINKIAPYKVDWGSLLPQIYQAPGSFVKVAVGTFSGIFTFFTLAVISFYSLRDRPNWEKHLIYLFGTRKAAVYYSLIIDLEKRLGNWIRGELLLMFIIGLMSYIGFLAIGIPFALPLAFIAGLLELIPSIGPTIAAALAALVGFYLSPLQGALTILLAILIQQIENTFIVPKIMQHAVGLHPVITIITLLIGFTLGGPLLAIISIPTVVAIQVVISHFHAIRAEGIDLG